MQQLKPQYRSSRSRRWPGWSLCLMVLLILRGTNVALAQEQDTILVPVRGLEESQSERGFFVGLQAGAVFGQLDALNEVLVRNLYGPLSESILSMGLSAHRYQQRFVWGGELYNFMTSQSRLNGQTSLLQFHYGMLHVGHRLWRKADQQHLYLLGGLGYGGAFMRIRLGQGVNAERFQAGGPLADVALRGHHHFILQGSTAYIARLSVTLGYLHSFDNAWLMRGLSSNDLGLPVSPRGPYLRIGIGMGNWNRFERKEKIVESSGSGWD